MAHQLDEFLARHAPAAVAPPPPALVAARASIADALGRLARLDEAALEKGWPWRGEEADVRYGLYRQYEALEQARAEVAAMLAAGRPALPPAQPMLAAATIARWELHGLLAGLEDGTLDQDPGSGEWTLRLTLGHIVAGQRGYNWGSAWWLSRRDAPADEFPQYIPDEVASGLPSDEDEASGSLADIRARFDDVLDQGSRVFASLTDGDLDVRARWSGIAVDVRFRLYRWSSHIREHAVQADKTLVMIGRPTPEPERVTRMIGAAYGRLEAEVFMLPADSVGLADALAHVRQVAAEIEADAMSVASAAAAGRGA